MDDKVALIDLDGTVADYDAALISAMRSIQAPDEVPYGDRYTNSGTRVEIPYVEARRKMIQRQPGFWKNLAPLSMGFEIVEELRQLSFMLHVMTKGPTTTPTAWSEKVEWCRTNLRDAIVTVTGDKSLVYGRVLVDDFPPYFEKWLAVRPRGLIVCVAHPWNEDYATGGKQENPNILRYDGTTRAYWKKRLIQAYYRKGGEA